MENIKFTTTNGYEVEMKPFTTMEDEDYIQESFTEGTILHGKTGDKQMEYSVNANKNKEARKRTIEVMVVDIKGEDVNKEISVYERFRKLNSIDGKEILAKIEEVTGDKKKETDKIES